MTLFAFDVLCWECRILESYITQLVKDSLEATVILYWRPFPCKPAGWAWWQTLSHQLWLNQLAEMPSCGQKRVSKLQRWLGFYCGMYIAVECYFSHLLGLSVKCQSHLEHRRRRNDGELSGVFGRHRSSHFYCRLKYSVIFENCNYVGVEKHINLPSLKSLYLIQSVALPVH